MDGLRTEEGSLWAKEARTVGVGAIGGLIAGIPMGLLFQFGMEIMPVLGAFAGEASALRGWTVHLTISGIYGALFTFIMAYPPVRSFMGTFRPLDYMFVGVIFAVVMAAATIALLPFVFELPWTTAASPGPSGDVPGPGLVGLVPAMIFGIAHLVYGAILGTAYGLVTETPDRRRPLSQSGPIPPSRGAQRVTLCRR